MHFTIKKSPGVPFPLRRFPFFYGWIILLVGTFGIFMSIPGQTMGVSVFTDDIIRVLGISRVSLSLAYMVGTIASALLLTPVGKKLDRYGARKIGTLVVFALGVVLGGLSFLDKTSAFLKNLLPLPPAATAFLLITLGFFLLRFLGQGVLTLLSRNMVMKWFEYHRGMANAVMGVATSFAFSLAPRVLNSQIVSYGWSGAWKNMGLFLIIIGTLSFWILSRDNPEECGLKPDGNLKIQIGKRRPPGHPERDFTLKEARKTLPFWVMGMTLAMNSLYGTAVTFHIISIFDAAQIGRSAAIGIFLPSSLAAVAFNFAGSWLSDYVKFRYILIVQIISQLATMFFLARLAPGLSYVMVIIGYGAMGGLFNVTNSIVWPRYYGRTHLNSITGMIMGFVVAGSAVGPYLFSLFKDVSGSYRGASLLCFFITLVLLVLALFVRRPAAPVSVPAAVTNTICPE